MRLLAPAFLFLVACSGAANSGIDTEEPQLLPAPASPTAAPPPAAPGDPVTTPPTQGGDVGELATVALTIDKDPRPIDVTDANGFVPSAKVAADGKTLEIRAWVTPPNTHEGGYAVEESFVLAIPMTVGKSNCGQGAASYSHSRLYEQSPASAPVYNPFEAFVTKDSGGACTITTKSISDTWVEGTATGTLTRTKSVNGNSAASLAFTITYRVPRHS